LIEVEGEDGVELWVVVSKSDGTNESYRMHVADGTYSYFIPSDRFTEGDSFWISDTKDGDPVGDQKISVLPALKRSDDDGFPFFLVVLAIIIIALIVVVLGIVLRGRGDEEIYEE
jgi:hypothetical protein